MLATVGWYQSAVSGLSTGSPAGAPETGVSEAGVTGRSMARRASCRGAAAGPSKRKPSVSSSAGAAASGVAASGAGVVAAVVAPVVAAGDSGRALAGGAVTASPAREAAEGALAAGVAVLGVVLAAGVPGAVPAAGVAAVPGVVVAARLPGVVLAAGLPGVVLAAGLPGVLVAAGVSASVLGGVFGRAREVVVFARGLAVGLPDRADGVFDRVPAVVVGPEAAAVVFGRVPGPDAVDGVPGSSEAAPEASAPSAVAGHASVSMASALAWSRPVEAGPAGLAGPPCAPGSACRRAAFCRRAWGRDRFPLPANYPRGSRSPKSRHHSVACGFCELVGERHRKFRRPAATACRDRDCRPAEGNNMEVSRIHVMRPLTSVWAFRAAYPGTS